MNVKDLYDLILSQMTAEEALKYMLDGAAMQYENLKYDEEGNPVHPIFVIVMAAREMGWQIVVENKDGDADIEGICVGTENYLKSVLNEK